MAALRSALYGIFIFFSILLILISWKGYLLWNQTQITTLFHVATPAYLVIAGVVIGSCLYSIFRTINTPVSMGYQEDVVLTEKHISGGFFVGLIIGVVLAFLYINQLG